MSPPVKNAVFSAGRGLSAMLLHKRAFQSSALIFSEEDSKFKFMSPPSPPKLPEKEQREWEELMKRASQGSAVTESENVDKVVGQNAEKPTEQNMLHPDMRRGAPPEFDGDVNPKTGEVGGPKNEPLRWGSSGDWSFNGRTTDF